MTRRHPLHGLDDDIRDHIEREAEENVARGMTVEKARRAALRTFGGMLRAKEDARAIWVPLWAGQTVQDVRFALRSWWRSPAFAGVVVLTLALGIGATTAIFTVVHSIVIKPLPYPDSDRLLRIGHRIGGIEQMYFSDGILAAYVSQTRAFQEVGAWDPDSLTATVTGLGTPEEVRLLIASRGLLAALGVPPVLGRWFSEREDSPGAAPTVLLSHAYWQQRFGGNREVLGRVLTIHGQPHEIIGVMPAAFGFQEPDIIQPLQADPDAVGGIFRLTGIARMKPGVSIQQAEDDVARILEAWFEASGVNGDRSVEWLPALRPLKQDVIGNIAGSLWVLMGAIGVVLLMACANVVTLLLVRTDRHHQEFALRMALGAHWTRLARSFLIESLTLAIAGGLVGVGLAYGGLQLLLVLAPGNLPRLNEIAIDPVALGVAVLVSVLSGLLFGLGPILKYARPQISTGLASVGRRLVGTRESYRSQTTLVAAQIALALVLLISAGLMIRSFQNLRGVQPGFSQPHDVQTFTVSIPRPEVTDPVRVTHMQQEIVERVRAIPGVDAVAFATRVPMDETTRWSSAITAQDPPETRRTPPNRHVRLVSPGFFHALGIPLVAGRDFTWTDHYERREVTIVSENLAREFWGSPSLALGRQIREFYDARSPWREIVGVAGDVYDDGVHQDPPATVYWPAGWTSRTFGIAGFQPRQVTFVVRSRRTATPGFLGEIGEAVRGVHSSLPVAQVRTLGQIYDQSMARTSFTLVMLAIAASMAVLLSGVGLYGVIAYAVSRRRREIGIRLALGAQPRDVLRLFVCRGLALTAIGVSIGLLLAAGVTRLMRALLFGVTPLDPITFMLVPVALVTVV
ncbi:MAG: ADOP family duplicated permease, partial [Vicinamibacterales bacterium]